MAPVEITEAIEAIGIGAGLIAQHHPHLREARIRYLFTSQRRKKCDRVRLGSAQKLPALVRYLSRDDPEEPDTAQDFIILLSRDDWLYLRDDQRVALVDHELCHCGRRATKTGWQWYIRGHDIEEFAEVIRRHGLWKQDLDAVADAIGEQLQLPIGVEV